MKNIHPIYNIKELMIRRELAKDPALKEENWERFLPQFKKRAAKKKKKSETKKKEYTPFPPEQQPRKIDLQLESGEYFLSETEKRAKKKEAEKEKQTEKLHERQGERAKSFKAPKEGEAPTRKRADEEDAATIAARLKGAGKPKKAKVTKEVEDGEFVEGGTKRARGDDEPVPKKKKKKSKA